MIRKTLPLTLVALALTGCTGAFVGNIFVVFVAVGIFFGTLGLGKSGSSPGSRSGGSTTDTRS